MFENYIKKIKQLNHQIETGNSVYFEEEFEEEFLKILSDENNFYLIVKEFTDTIYENKNDITFLINFLLIMSRIDIPENFSYIQIILSSLSLNFENNEIKDYGIRISESIKNKKLRNEFLKTIKIDSSWLQKYINDIIIEEY